MVGFMVVSDLVPPLKQVILVPGEGLELIELIFVHYLPLFLPVGRVTRC